MTPCIPAMGDMPKDVTANANNVLEAYVTMARCVVTDDVYDALVIIEQDRTAPQEFGAVATNKTTQAVHQCNLLFASLE